ncbi:hypothetical protein ACEXQB_010730 [Herbiconiux sp. P18]|uniref:hypothetical protein n=1 Tax=Herbiconiux liangxiaofengii TaxID=3342795 RepID=UPI0035B995EA
MARHTLLPQPLRHDAFRVSHGADLGVSEKRMRGPDLERPFHGVRQPAGGGHDVVARCRAYATRMRPSEVFSHTTAASLWGVPLPSSVEADTRLHVSAVGGGQRPRGRGVVGHEFQGAGMSAVDRDGLRVVDPVTCWLQLATMLSFDDLVAAGDHLVLTPRQQGRGSPRPFTTLDALAARLEVSRQRGARPARQALGAVRDGAESRQETRLRLALIRHGLPEPALNVPILGPDGGFVAFGDLVYPEFAVLVEYDGEQHRTSSRQYYRDVERGEALIGAGWMVIRETKETPRTGPRATVARTELALLTRGWRPPVVHPSQTARNTAAKGGLRRLGGEERV